MANSIDTGPGGFAIDGNQELFDVGQSEPSNKEKPYGPRAPGVDVSAGYVDENGRPKDLTKVTKTTLSKYLSDVTKGSEGSTSIPNDYPIDDGYQEIQTSPEGYPGLQSPGSSDPRNSKSFVTSEGSIKTLSDQYATISSTIKKGKKSSSNAIDGNNLLPGIPGTSGYTSRDSASLQGESSTTPFPVAGHEDTSSVIEPYVSAVLSKNRFTMSGQKTYGASASGNAGFNPSFTKQTRLGAFEPSAPTVSPDQLATVGPLLTMRAGKELGAASAGADPNSTLMQLGALLPGTAQLGISTVDVMSLTASDVMSQLTGEALGSADVLNVGSDSWGQLNNPNDPYSGTDALGMLALSVGLVAGIELLIDGISILLGKINPQAKIPTKDNQGRYTLGQYFSNSKSGNKEASGGIGGAIAAASNLNFGGMLGILPTTHPFSEALSKGTNRFFGIDDSKGVGGQLLGALKSSADSPGFNVVVARAIIRSGITVTRSLSKITGNPITGVFALIDSIRSSKLIAACNIFASLGDAILSSPTAWIDSNDPTKISEMDRLDDSVFGSTVAKNRLNNSLKLSWASNRASAQLLMPTSIFGANAVLKGQGQFSSYVGVPRESSSLVRSKLIKSSEGGRINNTDAEEFEKKLDASYVPFYFHDIRTNEIVSFHAFLASITDDYAASYDKTEGFGRVEPVRTYKGTERKINLSFYVAATSLPDFDDMWVKINKLTTLVYPQYTQGTTVANKSKSYVFTQPFSQLIGASPLVRIRLGDLLRSNYSPFALGRLFGVGNKNFTAGNPADLTLFSSAESISQADFDKLHSSVLKALTNPNSETYIPSPGVWPRYVDSNSSSGVSLPLPSIPGIPSNVGGNSKNADQFCSDVPYFEIVATKTHPKNPNLIIGQVRVRTDDAFREAYKDKALAAIHAKYKNEIDDLQRCYIDGEYVFSAESLTPTIDTLQKFAVNNPIFGKLSANSNFATDLADFLNPDKNAVAKAFKDTGGKGLAGFIESMNFDWYDKVTWETSLGRTAPKLCKVTIGFSPIHDISPGIDHFGFNRAPLYPVGIMGQE